MKRTSSRTLQARPARLAAAALTFFTAALLLLVAAGAAHAAVWVIPATDRAFPGTQASARQVADLAIALDAAGNEYAGVQVAVRDGGPQNVTFTWRSDSDPLITANTILDRVGYVNVTRPTTNVGARAGMYPDPLLPKQFGDRLSVPAGETTSFYLLTHVPYGTPGGDHYATLVVQGGADGTVEIPFSLHVWPFGWPQLSTRTGFSFNQSALERSLRGAPGLKWSNLKQRRLVLYRAFEMLQQHGISTLGQLDIPNPTSSSGHFDATKYAASIAPYLDASGLDMSATRIPWMRWWPKPSSAYTASSSRLMTYLTEMCKLYKEHGWDKKAYAYVMDETTKRWEELKAQGYARALHAASASSGYRMDFLLTDDPRPFSLGGVKQANSFLFDDVDIWGVRYFYYFGRIPAIRAQQSHGKKVWWYTYPNPQLAQFPNYIIDKPQGNGDQRAWGWLMAQFNVDGLMNYALNEWASASRGSVWRDPYRDTLTYVRNTGMRANGDTTLIYPGYDPSMGLDDPYAAPVSSLRLEALRDGLQDREYFNYARTLPGGAAVVSSALHSVITFLPKPVQKNVFVFPKYKTDPLTFASARLTVAKFIESNRPQ